MTTPQIKWQRVQYLMNEHRKLLEDQDPPKPENMFPVLFDEANIDLTGLENQVTFWNQRIQETRNLIKELQDLYECAQEDLNTFPEYVSLVIDLQQLQNQLNVLEEQTLMREGTPLETEEPEPVALSEKSRKRLHKRLKKKMNKLLHPDKTGTGFNKELFDLASSLLETEQYDELESLLLDIETRKSRKASSFTRKQLDERLRERIANLKTEFQMSQSILQGKVQSNEGMICAAYKQFGKSDALLRTALRIGIQIQSDLCDRIHAARKKAHYAKMAKHNTMYDFD